MCKYGANTHPTQISHCEQFLSSWHCVTPLIHARDTFHIENPVAYGAVSRSQSRVADFMMHDTNADQEISFAEFVEMDKKQDLAGTNNHPGFKLSVGMIATTKQENARLLKMIRG